MVYFDESLDLLINAVLQVMGEEVVSTGLALRDATGRLSFISCRSQIDQTAQDQVSNLIIERLGPYARVDQPFLAGDHPGAQSLLNDLERFIVHSDSRIITIIDRRIVGSGWLASPLNKPAQPPRVVFASLKGGVGRSTALAVAASDFAERGKNVLAIDLDLEAPGIGDILVQDERRPRFGVLDYLVEAGVGFVNDDQLSDFIGLSNLTTSSGGRVDVLPAIGSASVQNPENVLPKLSRAMTDGILGTGDTEILGGKISKMIDRFTMRETYDIVLLDSRAGLAELSAPVVLGLGALVLLFGTAQRQTITGYEALFSALRLLAERDIKNGSNADWRLMMRPVYAKATLNPEVANLFKDDLYDLFSENLYDEGFIEDSALFSINFSADDPDAPHSPLIIPFDAKFADFDPLRNKDQLGKPFYEQTFRPFLNRLDELIENTVLSLNRYPS